MRCSLLIFFFFLNHDNILTDNILSFILLLSRENEFDYLKSSFWVVSNVFMSCTNVLYQGGNYISNGC